MFSLTRRRREAERRKKLEELFRDSDTQASGKITMDQMMDIFNHHDIQNPSLVDEARKLLERSEGGLASFSDFMRLALMTDLCKVEYQDRVFRRVDPDAENKGNKGTKPSKGAESCPATRGMDRVELAFRKFDANRDGFLNRDEFNEMMRGVAEDQRERIFSHCDSSGRGHITLPELRAFLNRGMEMITANEVIEDNNEQNVKK